VVPRFDVSALDRSEVLSDIYGDYAEGEIIFDFKTQIQIFDFKTQIQIFDFQTQIQIFDSLPSNLRTDPSLFRTVALKICIMTSHIRCKADLSKLLNTPELAIFFSSSASSSSDASIHMLSNEMLLSFPTGRIYRIAS